MGNLRNKTDLKDAVVIATDSSVEEWKKDVLEFLEQYHEDFSTFAMSDHTLYLKGQKDMLGNVIEFIKNT